MGSCSSTNDRGRALRDGAPHPPEGGAPEGGLTGGQPEREGCGTEPQSTESELSEEDECSTLEGRPPPLPAAGSHGLLLYLSMRAGDAKVAVEVPAEATLRMLRRAVYEAGGPEPCRQLLCVGGRDLREDGCTPLSEVELMASEVTISVRQFQLHPAAVPNIVSAGNYHAAVLLEDGGVKEWGDGAAGGLPTGAADVAAVYAGVFECTALVVDRKLRLFHQGDDRSWSRHAQELEADIVCCSAFDHSLAVVTADKRLQIFGSVHWSKYVPSRVQGRVVAAAISNSFAVVVTDDDAVHYFDNEVQFRVWTTGLRPSGRVAAPPVAVSAGLEHYAVVMADGAVFCGGEHDEGQCTVPAGLGDVVSCACGLGFTVALRRDGTLAWWGSPPPHKRIDKAGRITAVSAAARYVIAVTATGRLVADGDEGHRLSGLFCPPRVAVRRPARASDCEGAPDMVVPCTAP